jgi:C4-dicarboxylate transporter
LIIAASVANRQAAFGMEKAFAGLLVLSMAATVFYGVLTLRQMQADYALRCPPKDSK